jgi:transcriptional regulator with XRE-family HTH domain
MGFLGNNIRLLRITKELSQKELAELIQTTRTSVANWELENSLPRIPDLIKIATYFNVSIDSLLMEDLSNLENLPTNTKRKSLPKSHINTLMENFDIKSAKKGIHTVITSNHNLSQTLKNMSETNLKLTSVIDKLMDIVEKE